MSADRRVLWAWEECPVRSATNLHDWLAQGSMFLDPKHVYQVCTLCGATGRFTPIEIVRWAVVRDERLSARETKRGERK